MYADLSGAGGWIVVSAVPAARPAVPGAMADEELHTWLRRQVSVWPAEIPIGADGPRIESGAAIFVPARPVDRYYCKLGADGSVVLALPVANLRNSPLDGARVWAMGEGAAAWVTVAAARLVGNYAVRAGLQGAASLEVTVGSCGPDRAVPYELWNHGTRGFGPVGRRLAVVRPGREQVDLAACVSAGVAGAVRPLLLGLLAQFGVAGSRHVDADGVVRRRHFTGYDRTILAWTSAAGIPSEM